MRVAIQVQEVQKRFDGVEALRGVSFTVEEGEIFGLVGPDGAGKTTTIRLLCGILAPDAGAITVLGYTLPKEKHALHSHLGYLSQQFSLYADLTVEENLDFFARLHEIPDIAARKEELLAFTALAPFRHRLAGHLSGGMKQKLALACALIHTPRLLLLDEPTTGVDPVTRRSLWELLARIREQGVTILLSTPYLDEAERCTHLVLLSAGEVLTWGRPDEIRQLVPGRVLELVAHPVRQAAHLLRTFPGLIDVQVFGDRMNLLIPEDSDVPERIRAFLESQGFRDIRLRPVPPSLENAFIALLRQRRSS